MVPSSRNGQFICASNKRSSSGGRSSKNAGGRTALRPGTLRIAATTSEVSEALRYSSAGAALSSRKGTTAIVLGGGAVGSQRESGRRHAMKNSTASAATPAADAASL